jgi:hypothetical protein
VQANPRLITIGELLIYPTGLDWNTLAEKIGVQNQGPDSLAQAIEQAQIIKLASEWVANYCEQPRGLQSTQQIETIRIVRNGFFGARAWCDREGWLQFKAANLPVTTVDDFAFAIPPGPLSFQPLAVPAGSFVVEGTYPQQFRITENSRDWTWTKSAAIYGRWTYTAGYPNAVLTAAVTKGSNKQLTVDTTQGWSTNNPQNTEMAQYQGNLNIYDGVNTELNVPIVSVDDATHVTVASLANDHDPTTGAGKTMGIGVSSVPDSIKVATIQACIHFAKARGAQALVMKTMGTLAAKNSQEILSMAEQLLEPWVLKM